MDIVKILKTLRFVRAWRKTEQVERQMIKIRNEENIIRLDSEEEEPK
jgi:hypothetical protein